MANKFDANIVVIASITPFDEVYTEPVEEFLAMTFEDVKFDKLIHLLRGFTKIELYRRIKKMAHAGIMGS